MSDFDNLMGVTGEYAFINFCEISRRREPMGRYHNLSVFAAEGYWKVIEFGKTYLCSLEHGSAQNYFATPIKEVTLDKVLEENPEAITRIATYLYDLDRSKFDTEISAVQMREIRNEIEQKYREKISRLEKDNERLSEELKVRPEKSVPAAAEPAAVPDLPNDSIFRSEKIENRYYSPRINIRRDRILLLKDDNGRYWGHDNCIDLAPFKELLGVSDVKAEYCKKYSGIVISKRY